MALVASYNSTLKAVDHDLDQKMNVFYRFVDGKTFCILIDDDIDVGTLKKKILDHARATGGSPSTLFMSKDIFLVWNGRPLDEEMLLKDYNMTKNATIYVSYRNKGGCFMVSLSILTTICAALVGSTCTCGLSLFIIPLLLPFLFVLPFFCL